MKDETKTKEEIVQELAALHRQIADLKASEREHRQAEEALRESEERYRPLFEESRDAMFITSVEGKVVEVNQATLDLFGYTREEATRLPVLEAYANPEDRSRFRQELGTMGSVRDYEVKLRKKDGTEMDCLVTATVRGAKDGSILGYQGIIHDITERKQAEEALRASESKFRGLFENVPVGVFHSTPKGKLLTANPAFVRMLGYGSESELRDLDIAQDVYVDPVDRKVWMQKLEEEGELRNVELLLRCKDGQQVIVLENARAVRDEQSRVLYYEGTMTDITERKRAEEALRASEAKFRGLFENMLEGVHQSSLDGKYLTANPAFVRMLGYQSEEELLAVDGRDTWANPEDREHWLQKLQEEGELHNVELVLRRKDGQQVIVLENDRVVRDEQGKVLYNEGTMTDITERKRAEEALRASEAKFRGLFENLLEGVYQSSPEGKYITANPAFVRMLGYQSEEELLAVDARDTWADLEDRERWIQKLEEEGELHNFELILESKDGHQRIVLGNDRVVRDEQGRILYHEGTVTDITEWKQAEEAMFLQTRELAVLDERNRMAREIHDTLAQGFTGIVLQLEAAEQALEKNPAEVTDHLSRAKNLGRECLEEARRSVWNLRPLALEELPLDAALQEEVSRFASMGRDKASFSLSGDRRELPSNVQSAILRICQESLSNVRRHARATEVKVELIFYTDAVCLKVQDNGIGFNIEKVRAAGRQSGFGLTVMEERASLLGGTLAVKSQKGKGTLVEVRIPTA